MPPAGHMQQESPHSKASQWFTTSFMRQLCRGKKEGTAVAQPYLQPTCCNELLKGSAALHCTLAWG